MIQEFEYPKSAADAFTDALQAMKSLGRVRYYNPEKGLLLGQIRYQLTKVNATIQVVPRDNSSLMTVQMSGIQTSADVANSVTKVFTDTLRLAEIPPSDETDKLDKQANTLIRWALGIIGLIAIIVLSWNPIPKRGYVSTNNAVLYTSMDVLDEAYQSVMDSSEMWVLNRGLANNPLRDQLLPSYQPMMKGVTDRVLQQFERSGKAFRIRARTSCEILGKATDPVTDETLYKVRLTSGHYSTTIGYIHKSAVKAD